MNNRRTLFLIVMMGAATEICAMEWLSAITRKTWNVMNKKELTSEALSYRMHLEFLRDHAVKTRAECEHSYYAHSEMRARAHWKLHRFNTLNEELGFTEAKKQLETECYCKEYKEDATYKSLVEDGLPVGWSKELDEAIQKKMLENF
jgi:hypothetical protein